MSKKWAHFFAFVNVYLFLLARLPARGPPSLKSSAVCTLSLSEHTWWASLPPCRAFLSVISGTESVISRQGCVGTNARNPAVTYCHWNGMVSGSQPGERRQTFACRLMLGEEESSEEEEGRLTRKALTLVTTRGMSLNPFCFCLLSALFFCSSKILILK